LLIISSNYHFEFLLQNYKFYFEKRHFEFLLQNYKFYFEKR